MDSEIYNLLKSFFELLISFLTGFVGGGYVSYKIVKKKFLNQKIKSGDGSKNNLAGRDLINIENNYSSLATEEERDFVIIDEIFNSVIKQLCGNKDMSGKGYLEPEKKIKLNFPKIRELIWKKSQSLEI